jgi:hypothetical protein
MSASPCVAQHADSARTSAADSTVPVGLLGLTTMTARVRAVTRAAMAAAS